MDDYDLVSALTMFPEKLDVRDGSDHLISIDTWPSLFLWIWLVSPNYCVLTSSHFARPWGHEVTQTLWGAHSLGSGGQHVSWEFQFRAIQCCNKSNPAQHRPLTWRVCGVWLWSGIPAIVEEVKPKLKVRAGWMDGARSLMVMEEQSGERA